jgi:maltooligosyltrehalose trehalohydrolase
MGGLIGEAVVKKAGPQDQSKAPTCSRAHAMPFGATFLGKGQGTLFRLWAPAAKDVFLVLDENGQMLPMQTLNDGWRQLQVPTAGPGTLYAYHVIDASGDCLQVPDPASRFQPRDVHGPSQVIDPRQFQWQDADWRGRPWEETVLYELHVGTFSPERSFRGVQNRLGYLQDLGITAIELMPVSDFPGTRNWGYDGVLPFAPDSRYGSPDDLKSLVQAAHAQGIQVFMDVVYNHFGPEGNYLHAYATSFFNEGEATPWGAAINFSGKNVPDSHARNIRDFFIHNALYWLEEYHLDGLRLDAVHAIRDDSSRHFLEELAETIRDALPKDRLCHLILENPDNQARYIQPKKYYDAQWNDDFHHAAHVLLTGEASGYYCDFTEQHSERSPLEHLAVCLTEGFSYQGQYSTYHCQNRGEESKTLPPTAFVNFLQNHDQMGNRALGERLGKLSKPAPLQALVSILLLSPGIPLLFMGEEWQSDRPFLFFCDFEPDLNQRVCEGRLKEFAAFPEFSHPDARRKIPDPTAFRTFEASSLDWLEPDRPPHKAWRAFYKQLLEIRKEEIIPRLHALSEQSNQASYQLYGSSGLMVQWPILDQSRLILVANLGDEAVELTPEAFLQEVTPIWQSNHHVLPAVQSGKLAAWSVLWAITSPEMA